MLCLTGKPLLSAKLLNWGIVNASGKCVEDCLRNLRALNQKQILNQQDKLDLEHIILKKTDKKCLISTITAINNET
jgi:hypothetical protein